MTSCVNTTSCTCLICGQLVNNISNIAISSTPTRSFPSDFPTPPPSLPRLGTQFTPGLGEIAVDDMKETIPFQDLSKLAKRQEWAVVKMTNVPLSISVLSTFSDTDLDPLGFDYGCCLRVLWKERQNRILRNLRPTNSHDHGPVSPVPFPLIISFLTESSASHPIPAIQS